MPGPGATGHRPQGPCWLTPGPATSRWRQATCGHGAGRPYGRDRGPRWPPGPAVWWPGGQSWGPWGHWPSKARAGGLLSACGAVTLRYDGRLLLAYLRTWGGWARDWRRPPPHPRLLYSLSPCQRPPRPPWPPPLHHTDTHHRSNGIPI